MNSPDTQLREFARTVIAVESAAVERMAAAIDDRFEKAVRLILDCNASVLTAGVGKAGHIARKLSATFASTGTPSHFISASDAVHGDAGSIRTGDVVLILSSSGESDEITRLLSVVKKLNHPVIAITAALTSSLGRNADIVIETGRIEEACPLRLAPSASTTAMLAVGDALALTVMHLRQFTADDFAIYHPAGQLGRKLTRVSEAMTFRKGENLPVASDKLTVGQVLREVSRIKRRSGAVILIDEQTGRLTGLFSDGDLRRLVVNDDASALRQPVAAVMTRNPKRISADALASAAMAMMKEYRVDEIPVVDADDRPVGLIDVQDLVVLK
ncbi:MAG TPA: KpsF/GutQ family sugar-phosphate isomerase, partial [Tepidisphaeraceae bacterium]